MNFAKRPKTIVCYICGREYGSKSLTIHIKTCEKKWYIEQDQLPKKQRRPCPQAPDGFDNMISVAQGKKPILTEAQKELNAYDNMAVGGKQQIMDQYNDAAYKNWDLNVLEACPHCNRTFLPRPLEIHLKSCKAGKPLKAPIARSKSVYK